MERSAISRGVTAAALSVSAFAAPPDPETAPAVTPQALADEIKQAMADLQAANDERLSKLEAGIADVDLRDKVATINERVDELKSLADEFSTRMARMTMTGGPSDAANERQHAARFFTMASGRKVRPTDTSLDVEAYRAYTDAFSELVRNDLNYETLSGEHRAAMQVGSDRDGGYLVPPEMSSEIERRVFDTSPMRQEARIITIGSDAWEAPYKSSSGVSGGWVGEKQPRPATGTGDIGMQRIEAHEQYAYPEVTQKMLDDGMLDVEAYLVEDVEDIMGRTENTAFVSGNGVLKPTGFLNYSSTAEDTADASRDWGTLQQRLTGAAGGFPTLSSGADDPSCLVNLIADLNPTYRQGAIWTMNRQTEATVRTLRDADGRYLVGFGDLQDGTTGFNLHGFPIRNFEDMPNIAANSYSIAFGNFRRGYLIVDRMGYRLLRDPYTNKPYVGFYITKRTGGDVRNFDAIKLLKFAAS